jgi:hypothetical protein
MYFTKQTILLLGAFLPFISAVPVPDAAPQPVAAPVEKIAGKYIIRVKPGVDVQAHTAWATDIQKRSNLRKREVNLAAVSLRLQLIRQWDAHICLRKFTPALRKSIASSRATLDLLMPRLLKPSKPTPM